jgi:hypothetical protein
MEMSSSSSSRSLVTVLSYPDFIFHYRLPVRGQIVVARDHGNTFERCSVDYVALTVRTATEPASTRIGL